MRGAPEASLSFFTAAAEAIPPSVALALKLRRRREGKDKEGVLDVMIRCILVVVLVWEGLMDD
jgi:hypothetical protein